MKKLISSILIFTIFILSFTACASPETTASSESVQPVEVSEENVVESPAEETSAEEPTAEPTEEPTPDVNDPQAILEQFLVNPNAVFGEDASAMADNEGGQFGPVDVKSYNADENVFEFTSGSDSAYVRFNTLLDEVGDNREQGSPQGLLLKFQPPEEASSLYINFYGPNDSEFGIDFFEEGKPSLFIYMEATKESFKGDLTLETGKFYYLLLALDSNGEAIGAVWEEGNPDSLAGYTENLAERQGGDNYQNSTRSLSIGFAPNNTLKIAEYSILTFDGINEEAGARFEAIEEEAKQASMDVSDLGEAAAFISNPQPIFQEDFRPEDPVQYWMSDRHYTNDGAMIFESSDTDWHLLNIGGFLTDFTGDRESDISLAAYMTFSFAGEKDFRFEITSNPIDDPDTLYEEGINFNPIPQHFTQLPDNISPMDEMQGELEIKTDTPYRYLMGIDNTTNHFIAAIWEPDSPENALTYSSEINESVKGQPWTIALWIFSQTQIRIDEFQVLAFGE